MLLVGAENAIASSPHYEEHALIDSPVMDGKSRHTASSRAPMSSHGGFTAELVLPENSGPDGYFVSAYPYEHQHLLQHGPTR